MQKFETVKINKRKIKARQYSLANEGKWRIETPTGKYWVQDNDWLIPIGTKDKEMYVAMPGMAMSYLQAKDEDV